MIKKLETLQETELNAIMAIWLAANKEAHSFVDSNYWEENTSLVRSMMPEATIYVAEKDGKIVGFAGMMEDYLAGIFITNEYRSHGLGKALLDEIKKEHNQLSLSVFEKNKGAYQFYIREGFQVKNTQLDEEVNQIDVTMTWQENKERALKD